MPRADRQLSPVFARGRLRRKWAVAPSSRMKDVQHADSGTDREDHDRRKLKREAEQHQHGPRTHTPQDRMGDDPAAEPVQQTANLHPHPSGGHAKDLAPSRVPRDRQLWGVAGRPVGEVTKDHPEGNSDESYG